MIILAFLLFFLGLASLGVMRRNFLILLVSLELLLLAINLNFLFASLVVDDVLGKIALCYY